MLDFMAKAAKNLTLWLVLGGVVLALFVAQAPATWGAYWLSRQAPGLVFSGVSGSLWKGRAAVLDVIWEGERYTLGPMRWDLRPWTLLILKPCAKLSGGLPKQTVEGTVCSGIGGSLSMKDTTVSVPAALAQLWLPVQVNGNLDLSIQQLELSGNKVESLRGSVSWRQASFHNGQAWVHLGDIGARLLEEDGGLLARFQDLGGPLDLKMEARVNPSKNPTSLMGLALNGTVASRTKKDSHLTQWLKNVMSFVSTGEVDGRYQVSWKP